MVLGEAVDLVEEQNRAPLLCGEPVAGFLEHLADVFDPRGGGRQGAEGGVGVGGDEHRQCRLAGAGRAPEKHGDRLTGLHDVPEGGALAKELWLTGDLVDRPRPHAGGQRGGTRRQILGASFEKVGHQYRRYPANAAHEHRVALTDTECSRAQRAATGTMRS